MYSHAIIAFFVGIVLVAIGWLLSAHYSIGLPNGPEDSLAAIGYDYFIFPGIGAFVISFILYNLAKSNDSEEKGDKYRVYEKK